jgi:hypothetical protein
MLRHTSKVALDPTGVRNVPIEYMSSVEKHDESGNEKVEDETNEGFADHDRQGEGRCTTLKCNLELIRRSIG